MQGAKPAVQKRSQQTRDALIGALEDLLQAREFGEISVAEIAARAGVSPASIYQRFKNKDAATAILLELNIRKVTEWNAAHREDAMAIIGAPTLRQAMLRLGALSWRQVEALRHIMRPAYLYSMLRPEAFGAEWRARLDAATAAGFRPLLEAHQGEIVRADLDRAASSVAGLVNMMAAGLLLHRPADGEDAANSTIPATEGAFAAELADVVCGYLAMPEGGAAPEETRS